MVKDIYEIKECPDCASMSVIYNERRQQVVCKSCGLIYEPLTPKEEETYLSPTHPAIVGEKVTASQQVGKKSKPKASAARKKAKH